MLVLTDDEVERRWAAIVTDIEDAGRRRRVAADTLGHVFAAIAGTATGVTLLVLVHDVVVEGMASLARTLLVR